MKKAIITGATGFVGSKLTRMLIQNRIHVLAIGRKSWDQVDKRRLEKSEYLQYVQLDMSNIEALPMMVSKMLWDSGSECVFYHFAWGGIEMLSDLDVDAQMRNVGWSVKAMQSAKLMNCKKFIYVGSMEEAIASRYLSLNYHFNSEYNRHVVYSIAKKCAREMLKVFSNSIDIDLVLATNSHVMGANDDKDSFLQVTLSKLINNEELIFSTGEQLFDVISVNDCALAYKLIGQKGLHGSEYWIGSGKPRRLKEYIEIMANLYPSNQELQFGKMPYNDISLNCKDFSIDLLNIDTGFRPLQSYEDAVHELYHWLRYEK